MAATFGALVALAVAAVLVVWEPWHGPIVLSLSSSHGVDTGDLVVAPLVALAVVGLRYGGARWTTSWRSARSPRWAGPVSAAVLGVLLVGVGAAALEISSSLTPVGGGTFDGAIRSVGGSRATPIRTWSHLALTYDGAILTLYVNGQPIAHESTTGAIESSADPMWIGGNHPYGEHFRGLIDDVRVYDRALDQAEIATDMSTPVDSAANSAGSALSAARPANTGLVASYSFDAGSGVAAADSSGHRNDGTILGAVWVQSGHSGGALDFDGRDDMVRVPASASLDLGRAMTLSAWIWPSASQGGWRTVVQRQTDAQFLDASSGLTARSWPFDGLIAAAVVVGAAWFALELIRSRGRWLAEPRRFWSTGVVVYLAGCLLDAALTPHGTVMGPLLLAAWFALTSTRRAERVIGWLLVAALCVTTVVSLVDVAHLGLRLGRNEGGNIRSLALGVVLLVAGLLRARARPAVADVA